jgi:hypothetical protein
VQPNNNNHAGNIHGRELLAAQHKLENTLPMNTTHHHKSRQTRRNKQSAINHTIVNHNGREEMSNRPQEELVEIRCADDNGNG